MKYNEYKQLNLTQIGQDVRRYWEENETFEKGQKLAEGHPAYVFYDGPPSANGKPGIHHVMARTSIWAMPNTARVLSPTVPRW